MKNLKNITIIVFLFMSLLAGCADKPEGLKTEEIIPVKAVLLEPRDINKTIEYVGNIRAFDEALIYSRVTGKVVEKVKEEGSKIFKGEPICFLDRDETGLKFERAPVESSLSGVVGRVYVDIGQNVNLQTPIAMVVSMDKVKINLDIPEKYLSRISLGQEAEIKVDAYPEKYFSGKVTKISPMVNPENRAAPIEISVDNPGHTLKSGMFARVILVIDRQQNVPVILKEAVIGRDLEAYVYIVENDIAKSRKVKLGLREGPYYEVKDGLKKGDLVVIVGQQRLYDNAKVKVELDK